MVDAAYGSETVSVSVDGLTLSAGYNPDPLFIKLHAPDITLQNSRPYDVTADGSNNVIDASGAGPVILRRRRR
jgi:hypothetical protein